VWYVIFIELLMLLSLRCNHSALLSLVVKPVSVNPQTVLVALTLAFLSVSNGKSAEEHSLVLNAF
jgi:hypothetical protein